MLIGYQAWARSGDKMAAESGTQMATVDMIHSMMIWIRRVIPFSPIILMRKEINVGMEMIITTTTILTMMMTTFFYGSVLTFAIPNLAVNMNKV